MQEVRPHWRAVRWVKPENVHLTLRFLGATAADQLEELKTALAALAAMVEPFELQLAAMGCFPNVRRPRVIWVGLAGAEDQLLALQRAVEQVVVDLGWQREPRPFART